MKSSDDVHSRLLIVGSLALILAACGGEGHASSPDANALTRATATNEDVERILARLVETRGCKMLLGRFIGISNDPSPSDASAGLQPATGRWWIRECEARRLGDRLVAIHIAGPGWVWVDQVGGKLGFHYRVQQHVPFSAHGTIGGVLSVLSYNGTGDVATVTFHRLGQSLTGAQNAGGIAPFAENGLAIVGSIFSGGGLDAVAAGQARTLADSQLSEAFQTKLSSDASFTVNLFTGATDALFIPLPSGVAPKRPFEEQPLSDDEHILAVENQDLHYGWPQVMGPFEPTPNAMVDFRVVGPLSRYEAICSGDLEPWLFPLSNGTSPLAEFERARPMTPVSAPVVSIPISRSCRWYLVTASDVESRQAVRVRTHF